MDSDTVHSDTSADQPFKEAALEWSYGWQNGTVFFGSSGFFTAIERKYAINYFFF